LKNWEFAGIEGALHNVGDYDSICIACSEDNLWLIYWACFGGGMENLDWWLRAKSSGF